MGNNSSTSMSKEVFQKERYAYSIRHMYEQEGSKTNYASMFCSKIVNKVSQAGGGLGYGYDGCPYRHQPESQLNSFKIDKSEISDIIK